MLTFPKLNTTKKENLHHGAKEPDFSANSIAQRSPQLYIFKVFFTCKSFSQKNYHIFLSSLIFDLNMEIMCPNHLKRVYLNSDPPIGKFGYYLLGFWETSFEVCAYS